MRGSAGDERGADAPFEGRRRIRRRRSRADAERWWRLGTGLVALGAVATWGVAEWKLGEVRPSDPVGLGFGIGAAVLLTIAMAWALRRRSMKTASRGRLGTARDWLLLHVYAGLLFLVAVVLHAGFRLPDGAISWSLWILSLWTVATGLVGLLVQRAVPRLLAAGTTVEVHYDRIPQLVEEIRGRCERLASGGGRAVAVLYERQLAPALASPRRDPRIFFGQETQNRLTALEQLRSLLPATERDRLEEMAGLVRTKHEIDVHYTLQQILRGWLWFHVPTAALLFLLVVLHVGTVIYY